MSVPRVVGNFFCCGYACNSWAAYASLINAFLLIIELFLGYYVTRCILICLEALNILKTTKYLMGFPQLSHVYTKDKLTLEKSVLFKYFPSGEALDCTVMNIIKLKQFYCLGLWLWDVHISWNMQVSLDMVKGHPARYVNIFCTRHWNLLQTEINKFNRNFDPNGLLVAAYRFFFKSLTASHSVLQRKKWRLLLNESFFKIDLTAKLPMIGQFRS